MKFREIFRFEVGRQFNSLTAWIYIILFIGLATIFIKDIITSPSSSDQFLNTPIFIARVMAIISMFSLLIASPVVGVAATRDITSRMEPLVYTAPISRLSYIGGHFTGAFAILLLIFSIVPIGLLFSFFVLGLDPQIIAPFHPLAYIQPILIIAIPNLLISTAILFSMASLVRNAMSAYIGGVILFFLSIFSESFLADAMGWWGLAKVVDPFGFTILTELNLIWSDFEKQTLLIGFKDSLFWNRLLWLTISFSLLSLAYGHFKFSHYVVENWRKLFIRFSTPQKESLEIQSSSSPIHVPETRQVFDSLSRIRQVANITTTSFQTMLTNKAILLLPGTLLLLAIAGTEKLEYLGIPLRTTTRQILVMIGEFQFLTLLIVPMVIIFFAGELVGRERDAGMNEIYDTMPIPNWVSLTGKFMGIVFMLIGLQVLLIIMGITIQLYTGYVHIELDIYLKVLLGLELTDYILFAAVVLAIHVLAAQKYIGHIIATLFYCFTLFHGYLGIEHNLFIFGSDLGWSYTDISGFGASISPWIWFKLYWLGWASLLMIIATLFWNRGQERKISWRLKIARRQFTNGVVLFTIVAGLITVSAGAYIFYNTNILNTYLSSEEKLQRSVAYEKNYGQYKWIPQPILKASNLKVEIFPQQRSAEILGTHRLENNTNSAINSIHLSLSSSVETKGMQFDRPAKLVLSDDTLNYQIYSLEEPLQPRESIHLKYEVIFKPEGFSHEGNDNLVLANGTYFTNQDWLPAIGYQPQKELNSPSLRKRYGLQARSPFPSVYDIQAQSDNRGREKIDFEAIIGTTSDQTAVGPGKLINEWEEKGRKYFHYKSGAPIKNIYPIFSADYQVYESDWNGVDIQIFHHHGHPWNIERIEQGIKASLEYFSKTFGPYPYTQIRFVESSGTGIGARSYSTLITYTEGFALLHPEADQRNVDLPFGVIAHEMAHQWWGVQLIPARVEGAPVLSESLSEYSALLVVEQTFGKEHLRRMLNVMRESYLTPRSMAHVPLLQATEQFLTYRKGPLAMIAMREYIGEEQINMALRELLRKHSGGKLPLPTSLDLYRELQNVTSDSLEYLLSDLFESNTYWELEAKQVQVDSIAVDEWQVTLEISANKFTVDSLGTRTTVPLQDWIEIGFFAQAEGVKGLGKPLYLQKHQITSEKQTIRVTVPSKPARAGIDPYNLLIEEDPRNNILKVPSEE